MGSGYSELGRVRTLMRNGSAIEQARSRADTRRAGTKTGGTKPSRHEVKQPQKSASPLRANPPSGRSAGQEDAEAESKTTVSWPRSISRSAWSCGTRSSSTGRPWKRNARSVARLSGPIRTAKGRPRHLRPRLRHPLRPRTRVRPLPRPVARPRADASAGGDPRQPGRPPPGGQGEDEGSPRAASYGHHR